jgi:hypothetical protein
MDLFVLRRKKKIRDNRSETAEDKSSDNNQETSA